MKKMNKLASLALAALALVSIESCSKTQFQTGKLVGTWNMTQEVVSSSSVSESPANQGSGSPVKTERTSELTYTPGGVTGVTESMETYLSTSGETSTYSNEDEYDVDVVTTTSTSVSGGTSNSVITESDVVTTKNYTVTFNKDRTFTLSNKTKTVSTTDDADDGYTRVFTRTSEDEYTYSGTWAYIGTDKAADEKNKERIGLWFTSGSFETITEDKRVSNDTDPDDFMDATANDYTSVYENVGDRTFSQTEPNIVWKMVEGSKDEMKITFTQDDSFEGETTSSYTDNDGTTTATSSKSENTSSSISTVSFSK